MQKSRHHMTFLYKNYVDTHFSRMPKLQNSVPFLRIWNVHQLSLNFYLSTVLGAIDLTLTFTKPPAPFCRLFLNGSSPPHLPPPTTTPPHSLLPLFLPLSTLPVANCLVPSAEAVEVNQRVSLNLLLNPTTFRATFIPLIAENSKQGCWAICKQPSSSKTHLPGLSLFTI